MQSWLFVAIFFAGITQIRSLVDRAQMRNIAKLHNLKDVSVDLLVHDLGLFFTLFRYEDVEVSFKTSAESRDRARLYLKVARGPYRGVTADFYANRDSGVDVRTISVSYGRQGGSPGSDYTVSLARYLENGDIAHIPDSLDNEHRFFLKLIAGACGEWGRRAAQNAADCVKIAARQ